MPVAVILAAGVLVSTFALVYVAREPGGDAAPRSDAFMSVAAASVEPAVHAFGDTIVAEVEIAFNADAVDEDTVRIVSEFDPYERAGPMQVERSVSGSRARWRFRFPLRCLREGCAPQGDRRAFDLPLANVAYRFESMPGPGSVIVDWAPITVVPRVDDDALVERRWRADVASAPDVSYRWQAAPLAAALVGGSVLFAGVAVALAWGLARRREEEEPETAVGDTAPRATPLERALALALDAARNGDSPDRRKALERAARELGARGFGELADRARALAWSPGPVDAVAVEDFARGAHAATNGGEA